MNPNSVEVQNNETRGSSYYRWEFSSNAVVVVYCSGQGNETGRFTRYFLVRGTATKVGRDGDPAYFGEQVTVE